MIKGIDVSNHQANVAWDAVVGSGVSFAIVKASEGRHFVDRYFARNWSEMKRVSLPRGSYHFARPSMNGPIAEADFFLSVVEPQGIEPGDILALDMEDEHAPVGQSLSGWSLAWMDRVQERVGFPPIFYTYNAYIGERRLTDPRLATFALWLASYQANIPPVPRPWSSIAIWQYTSSEIVPGAGIRIDCNQYTGADIDGLLALGKPGTAGAPAWRGILTGKAHWGGDPLPVRRVGDALLRESDGFDLGGFVLDEWTDATTANGQLVIREQ